MDPELIVGALTSRTKAIMPVHVHGLPADMDALGSIAKERTLAVIEDAAQAHLATYGGKGVGAIGACGAFSLQSSKNFSAGEGGIFTTNDPSLADRANRVRNFGQDVSLSDAGFDTERPLDGTRALESQMMGSMYRGNEMMAAFARAQLAKLPERTAAAQKNGLRLAAALRELPGVLPPEVPTGRTHVFHKSRVRFDVKAAGFEGSPPRVLRDAIAKALRAEGVEVVMWQGAPLSAQRIFKERKGFGRGFPWSAASEGGSNQSDGEFPHTQALLDSSLVLFSQSCPLIAQEDAMIDRYVEAFRRVWEHRRAIVDKARATP
jgi:dTDP-4-amino-4,6-dideoxygalactose transaminase